MRLMRWLLSKFNMRAKHKPAHIWFFWGCLWSCAVWIAVIFGIYFAMKGKP